MTGINLFTPKTGHQALFKELCKFHELPRPQRKALEAMTQLFGLEQPAIVFVDPSWLRKAAKRSELQPYHEVLSDLCSKWFAPSRPRRS